MTKRERELRASIAEISEKGQTLFNMATRTPEQEKELKDLATQLKDLGEQLEQCKTFDNAKNQLSGTPVESEQKRKWGNFGEFLNAVRVAKTSGGRNIDDRLLNAASGNNETTAADGGYLVATEWVNDLMASVYDESVFAKDVFNIEIGEGKNGLTLNIPKEGWSKVGSDEGVGVYGGALAYVVPEAGDITKSKPTFERVDLKLKKIAAIVYATDEILQDIPAMSSFMSQSATTALSAKFDNLVFNGNGTDEFTGILKASSLVTVTPEDAEKKITVKDIFNMYSNMRPRQRAGAKWYINSDIEPELMGLTIGNEPVYLPAGGISDKPYATLLGKPVVVTEDASELGTKGDIVFANMSEYITISKGKVKKDVSIHVEFVTDQTAFRFIMRVDGKPLRKDKYARKGGKAFYSPFITLDTRTPVIP